MAKKQDYYKNTTIVILGDHLSMSTSVKLENSERRVYNAFINSVVKKIIQLTEHSLTWTSTQQF